MKIPLGVSLAGHLTHTTCAFGPCKNGPRSAEKKNTEPTKRRGVQVSRRALNPPPPTPRLLISGTGGRFWIAGRTICLWVLKQTMMG